MCHSSFAIHHSRRFWAHSMPPYIALFYLCGGQFAIVSDGSLPLRVHVLHVPVCSIFVFNIPHCSALRRIQTQVFENIPAWDTARQEPFCQLFSCRARERVFAVCESNCARVCQSLTRMFLRRDFLLLVQC